MAKTLSDAATLDLIRRNKKIIEELFSNDREKLQATEVAIMMSTLFDPAAHNADKDKIFLLLLDMDRLTAFRALMQLPMVVADYMDREELEYGYVNYFAVSAWLISWELEKSTALAKDMQALGFDVLEPWAWESECRYRVVRKLCDENKIPPFNKPAFPWLITEASKFWVSIEQLKWQKNITSKNAFREEIKQHINELKQTPDRNRLIELRGDDRMHHFIYEIKTQGAFLAETDENFKKDPWSIYLKALTTLNNRFYEKGQLKLRKKRSGPKLGKKYVKDDEQAPKASKQRQKKECKEKKSSKKSRFMST